MADKRQLELRRQLLALAKLIVVLAIVGCMGWMLLTVFQAVREATRRIQNSAIESSSQSPRAERTKGIRRSNIAFSLNY